MSRSRRHTDGIDNWMDVFQIPWTYTSGEAFLHQYIFRYERKEKSLLFYIFESNLNKGIKYKVIYKIWKNTIYILIPRTGSQHLKGSHRIPRGCLGSKGLLKCQVDSGHLARNGKNVLCPTEGRLQNVLPKREDRDEVTSGGLWRQTQLWVVIAKGGHETRGNCKKESKTMPCSFFPIYLFNVI